VAAPALTVTGGQVRSPVSSGTAAPGAFVAGGSSDLPPNRLLKRSVIDCADAGAAVRQASPPATAAAAITLAKRLSPMRRP
jgi:hypothetical protein